MTDAATEFEPLIAEFRPDDLDEEIEEGYRLVVEVSTGRSPHGSPPGHLEVMAHNPPSKDGKPGGFLISQNILRFMHTFREGEDLNETTVKLRESEKQLKEVRAREKDLRKEVARLKAESATLKTEIKTRDSIFEVKSGEGMPVSAFTMVRNADESGISGTGRVLDGVVWHNGAVTVMWRTDVDASKHGYWSSGVYPSFEAFKFIHIDSHPTNKTEIIMHEADLEKPEEDGSGS